MNLPPIQPSPSSEPPTATSLFVKGKCYNCGWPDRLLLHNVLLRDEDRRVCTSCVLRLNRSHFCPTCFEFIEHPLSPSSEELFTKCVKCSSFTHTHCLSSPSVPSSSFLCPPCSQPKNFTFFPVPGSMIDQKLARVLLCATKIASVSTKNLLTGAKTRAERASQVAAAARKRAKNDLVHCDALKKWNDRVEGGSIEVSRSTRSVELGTGTNNLTEELNNGFLRGQHRQNNGSVVAVNNKNGGSENGGNGRGGNREKGCNGSMFAATSKSR